MKIKIHELAAKEFDDAIMWYDQQSEGLGKRFKKTVKDSIEKIKNNPEWYLKESRIIIQWVIALKHPKYQ